MSGSSFCPWAFAPIETAVKKAFDLGSLLGLKTQNKDVLLQTLWKASAEEIVNLSEKLSVVGRRISFLYFRKLYLFLISLLLAYVLKIGFGNL